MIIIFIYQGNMEMVIFCKMLDEVDSSESSTNYNDLFIFFGHNNYFDLKIIPFEILFSNPAPELIQKSILHIEESYSLNRSSIHREKIIKRRLISTSINLLVSRYQHTHQGAV